MKMKKLRNSIKEYFADMGILGGVLFGICGIFWIIVGSPFILIWCINEGSKSFFGGDSDA